MNRSQRLKWAKESERINRKYEEVFFPSVLRALRAKAKQAAARLRSGGVDAARNYLDTDLGNQALAERVRKIYEIVGVRHANRVYMDLRRQQQAAEKRFGFNEGWVNSILNFLQRFLIEKITFEVAGTTRDALLRVLTEGVEKGWGIDEMVKRLEELPFTRYQAARIVRTEINRAANVGASEGSKSFGFEQNKVWISLHDHRVRGNDPKDRADHRGLDGQSVDENDVFRDPRNGAELRFPGDIDAPAANTINCRCTVAYEARRDERGRLIPKRRRSVSVIMPGEINRNRTIVTI